jgi:hypothetical protein
MATAGSAMELIDAYTLGVESLWDTWKPVVAAAKPEEAKAISEYLITALDGKIPTPLRWRSIYICEQLLGQVMPISWLTAAGALRLFESRKLGMKSADDIGKRWDQVTQSNNEDGIRAVYGTLLDDLHWFYNKRALDRRLRMEVAKPMVTRTLITLFVFCVGPFIVLCIAQALGYDLLAKVGDFRSTLIGAYTAIAFGALGAIFSRITSFQGRFASLDYDEVASSFVGRSLNLRQAIGAIGALVVYFAIFGELLGGNLFPKVSKLLENDNHFWISGELAKLIVWSFLSGFSERMVPEFLARTEATAASASRPNT